MESGHVVERRMRLVLLRIAILAAALPSSARADMPPNSTFVHVTADDGAGGADLVKSIEREVTSQVSADAPGETLTIRIERRERRTQAFAEEDAADCFVSLQLSGPHDSSKRSCTRLIHDRCSRLVVDITETARQLVTPQRIPPNRKMGTLERARRALAACHPDEATEILASGRPSTLDARIALARATVDASVEAGDEAALRKAEERLETLEEDRKRPGPPRSTRHVFDQDFNLVAAIHFVDPAHAVLGARHAAVWQWSAAGLGFYVEALWVDSFSSKGEAHLAFGPSVRAGSEGPVVELSAGPTLLAFHPGVSGSVLLGGRSRDLGVAGGFVDVRGDGSTVTVIGGIRFNPGLPLNAVVRGVFGIPN